MQNCVFVSGYLTLKLCWALGLHHRPRLEQDYLACYSPSSFHIMLSLLYLRRKRSCCNVALCEIYLFVYFNQVLNMFLIFCLFCSCFISAAKLHILLWAQWWLNSFCPQWSVKELHQNLLLD